jgi:hypothetical protein
MCVTNPSDYFDDCHLRESRVLGFACNESTRQVRLDVDYAAEVVSHWFEAKLAGASLDEYQPLPSDFRRFTFFEASWLSIDPKASLTRRDDTSEWLDILKIGRSGLPIIGAFTIVRAEGGFIARMELNQKSDYLFEFRFRDLDVQRRRARGVPIGESQWIYQDVDTKATFDFYEPFPR